MFEAVVFTLDILPATVPMSVASPATAVILELLLATVVILVLLPAYSINISIVTSQLYLH